MTPAATLSPLLTTVLCDGATGQNGVALSSQDGSVSYAQLRRDVLEIRDWLRRLGCTRGDRVAICLPKSIAAVELIFGILAADATYVPLNHRSSIEQLRRILEDLQPFMIIGDRGTARALLADPLGIPTGMRVASIGGGSSPLGLELVGVRAGTALEPPADSEGLAVILYTSGSTGDPKGIMLSHENLASFSGWAMDKFEVSSADQAISHAPLNFDLSIFDIFSTLRRHGTVHLLDETTARFPGAVRAFIEGRKISIWYSVPTALVRLQEREALTGLSSLRLILFAGEVFPVPVLKRLMNSLPRPEYINLYGPTETNVCTYYRVPGQPASDLEALPIGRPCEHLEVGIRDETGNPLPIGEIGEICVAGPTVMRGYWGRHEATHASRLPDRHDSYRTGDVGYVRDDGNLMFMGRRDQQVKVRGYRIELLAFETVLQAHPSVREAAAVVVPNGAVGDSLAAFIVPREEGIAVGDIRKYLSARLPPHYQPDHIAWLDEMPRTPNGKCDRKLLFCNARARLETRDR
jgi:amino acid adenylation domain-containing protein